MSKHSSTTGDTAKAIADVAWVLELLFLLELFLSVSLGIIQFGGGNSNCLHSFKVKMPKNQRCLRIFRGDKCYRFFSASLNWSFVGQVFPRVRKMPPNPQISSIFWHFYLRTVQQQPKPSSAQANTVLQNRVTRSVDVDHMVLVVLATIEHVVANDADVIHALVHQQVHAR